MRPKGSWLPLRSRAICSSALNISAEIMEISSRISTCAAPQPVAAVFSAGAV